LIASLCANRATWIENENATCDRCENDEIENANPGEIESANVIGCENAIENANESRNGCGMDCANRPQ